MDSNFTIDLGFITKVCVTYYKVSPLPLGIFQGYIATMFAYGATGSRKTYTTQVLRSIKTLKEKEIVMLDNKDGHIHLKGLSRVPVSSLYEFEEAFSCGIQRQKTAHIGLNDVSSRSHGVLVISVLTRIGDGSRTTVTGKLNLLDLAGNEDNRRTCNEGIRLIDSAKINQSLFALSNYRESKLTRIMQDCLGETSSALMVAYLNPRAYKESVHTIGLVAISRHISNFVASALNVETPKVKVDMEAKLRAWLESKGKTKSL